MRPPQRYRCPLHTHVGPSKSKKGIELTFRVLFDANAILVAEWGAGATRIDYDRGSVRCICSRLQHVSA